MSTIFVNEDDAHFYSCHPTSDMTVGGLEQLVDYYAQNTQVGGVLFCTNLQKALFDSKAWEPLYADYDPQGGPDQPCLQLLSERHKQLTEGDHGANWVHNLWTLNRARGIDHHSVWLERCRHHGIEGWLTMRMNDCHGLKEFAQTQAGIAKFDQWLMLCASKHWQGNPQLRRAPWRWECSWEGAYDYSHKEVRDHHMSLIIELCERFDMHGLELDWMRWGMVFAPGKESAGRALLNDFVREVRSHLDACAKRVGHPVRLGVRVPAEPQEALANGFDVPAWVRNGYVDQVTLSGFFGLANFDFPIELWRLILGDEVRILTHGAGVTTPYPEFNDATQHLDFHHGSAASALQRGSQGIYLFNECYTESSRPAELKTMLQTIGSIDTVQKVTRRHPVTFPAHRAPGDSSRTILPITLTPHAIGGDMGRMEHNISLRIHIGPKPQTGKATLLLGFSTDTPQLDPSTIQARINGQLIHTIDDRPASGLEVNTMRRPKPTDPSVGSYLAYDLPLDLLQDDTNVIEFLPPEIDGSLTWAEIYIDPTA